MYTPLDSMGKVSLMMDLVSQRQIALGSNLANMKQNYQKGLDHLLL